MKKSLSRKRISSKRKNLLKRTLKKNYRKRVRSSSKRVRKSSKRVRKSFKRIKMSRTLKKNNKRYSRKKLRKQRGGERPPEAKLNDLQNNFLNALDDFELVSVRVAKSPDDLVRAQNPQITGAEPKLQESYLVKQITTDNGKSATAYNLSVKVRRRRKSSLTEEFTYSILRRYSDLYKHCRDLPKKASWIKFPPRTWSWHNLSPEEIQDRADQLNTYFSNLDVSMLAVTQIYSFFRPGYLWKGSTWKQEGSAESQIIEEINTAIEQQKKSIRVQLLVDGDNPAGNPGELYNVIIKNRTNQTVSIVWYNDTFGILPKKQWMVVKEPVIQPGGTLTVPVYLNMTMAAIGDSHLRSEWTMKNEYGNKPTVILLANGGDEEEDRARKRYMLKKEEKEGKAAAVSETERVDEIKMQQETEMGAASQGISHTAAAKTASSSEILLANGGDEEEDPARKRYRLKKEEKEGKAAAVSETERVDEIKMQQETEMGAASRGTRHTPAAKTASRGTRHTPAAKTASSSEILPRGWHRVRSKDGRTFYHNARTKTSQWNSPREL